MSTHTLCADGSALVKLHTTVDTSRQGTHIAKSTTPIIKTLAGKITLHVNTGTSILARVGVAIVNVNGTSVASKTGNTSAQKAVYHISTAASILTRIRLTLIKVGSTYIASETRNTFAQKAICLGNTGASILTGVCCTVINISTIVASESHNAFTGKAVYQISTGTSILTRARLTFVDLCTGTSRGSNTIPSFTAAGQFGIGDCVGWANRHTGATQVKVVAASCTRKLATSHQTNTRGVTCYINNSVL